MKYLYLFVMITSLFTSCQDKANKIVENKEDSKIVEIGNYLEKKAAKDSLHGVVLIGKNNEILLHEAYGYVDLDSIEKHSLDSQIGLASLGKMFTAISIMQLESKGKLDLNDLASKYLDDIENKAINDSVKIKHLLSHTSGLGDYFDELGVGNDDKENDLDYIYSVVKNDTFVSPVGKKFSYSNSGYILLGKIMEKITGTTYSDYVQRNILDKFQMTHTKIGLSDGGGSTTADDLWKFSEALRNRKLVEKRIFDMMIQKQSEADYGYGFKLKDLHGSKIYGHTGGFFLYGQKIGVASGFDIIDDEYTVIILTNRNPSLGGADVRNYLLDKLSGIK
ncbi:serine hydrolase domain-containing protein [Maribacter sp. 4G9]|uniref:serine hydrolase domain-containing protein n=1 Tax=Maribacter sp. 4G9 TaxID=1889777 RepID=UPI000C159938|nr:serine hydrolase domain-containing protein [Maribacter sp. 4G9]PIB30597.1 hypothetical protein BFP75_02365 [Maribacter sp. 4G9]